MTLIIPKLTLQLWAISHVRITLVMNILDYYLEVHDFDEDDYDLLFY